MGIISWFKRKIKRPSEKREVTPPKKLPPVTAVDVGTSNKARTGGYTIRGGRGSGGGGRGTITSTSGGITPQQAEQIEKQIVKSRTIQPKGSISTTPTTGRIVAPQKTITTTPAPVINRSLFISPPPKEKPPKAKQYFKEKIEKISEKDYEEEEKLRARKSGTFGEIFQRGDYPALVLKGGDVVGEKLLGISSKISGKIGLPELSKEEKKTYGVPVGETIVLAGFSPALSTTTDIMKSVPKTTDVAFKGTSQTLKGKVLKTDIKYVSERGSGTATGLTIQQSADDFTKSLTLGSSKKVSKGVKFPTGKIVTKETKFGGVEYGVAKSEGDKFLQASVGKTFKGTIGKQKDVSKYAAKTFGISKGEDTLLLGKVVSPSGDARTFGLIKDISSKDPSTLFKVSSGGNIISKQTAKVGESSLKSIVASSLIKKAPPLISPTKTFSTTGSVLLSKTSPQITKPRVTESTIQIPKQRPFIKTKQSPMLNVTSLVKEKTRLKLKTQLKQPQKTGGRMKTKELTKQPQIIKQMPLQKQTTKQNRITVRTPPLTKFKPKRTPILPWFTFRPQLPKVRTRRYKTSSQFKIKRSPSLLAIGEQIKSKKKGRGEFSGLGIRPILIPRGIIRRGKRKVKRKKKRK